MATADGGADHTCAGLAGRQLDRRGHGVSGPGGLVGDAGRDLAFAVYRGPLRAFLRLLLPACPTTRFVWPAHRNGWPCSHLWPVAWWWAGSRSWRAARPARPSSGAKTWSGSTRLSQEMMLHEDAEGLIRDLPRLIDRIFALDGVVLYVCDQDQFYASTAELPMSMQAEPARHDPGPESDTLAIPADLTATALMLGMRPVGALGLAAGDAFARGCHGGQRSGGHRAGAVHRHRGLGAHGSRARGRTAAHRADRLAHPRTAHPAHLDSRRRHHAARSRGPRRSRRGRTWPRSSTRRLRGSIC